MEKREQIIAIGGGAAVLVFLLLAMKARGDVAPAPATLTTPASSVAGVPNIQLMGLGGVSYDPNGSSAFDWGALLDTLNDWTIPEYDPLDSITVPGTNANMFPLFGYAVGSGDAAYTSASPLALPQAPTTVLPTISALTAPTTSTNDWRTVSLNELSGLIGTWYKGKRLTAGDVVNYTMINDRTGALR